MMRKSIKMVSILLTTAVLVGLVLYFAGDRILYAIGDFLLFEDELEPAGVIHVIAGDDYRTEYAIQLYQQGYGRYMFFTGGYCEIHGWYHGEHGQQLALSRGVPAQAIAYDDSRVTSTYDEAALVKAWMEQNPDAGNSVIVVSDPFHMRRARWTYRRIMGHGVEIRMAPVPFDQTNGYQRKWWVSEPSRTNVREEYTKYFYYILRYQLFKGRAAEWLATFDTQ